MPVVFVFIIAIAANCCTASEPGNQDDAWGHLTGKIVVKGQVPANPPEDVANNADKDVCLIDGKVPLDDNIVAGDKGELRDVYVMMYLGRGVDEPTYHPSYEKKKEKEISIDNVKCRFVPHALFVRPGQKLTLKNSDAIGHNCHIVTFNNEHNINLPPNGSHELVLENSEKIPGEVKCDVHKWMDAVLLIRDNPYVAITDAEGNFKIENIPAGDWKFQFWHKKVGYLKTIDANGKEVGRRGEIELSIGKDKTLDLGTLKLPAEAF
jgi:plastocyanin